MEAAVAAGALPPRVHEAGRPTPALQNTEDQDWRYFAISTPENTPPASPANAVLPESGAGVDHRELRELQESRVQLLEAMKEQQQVEQSVSSLLKRLERIKVPQGAPSRPAGVPARPDGMPAIPEGAPGRPEGGTACDVVQPASKAVPAAVTGVVEPAPTPVPTPATGPAAPPKEEVPANEAPAKDSWDAFVVASRKHRASLGAGTKTAAGPAPAGTTTTAPASEAPRAPGPTLQLGKHGDAGGKLPLLPRSPTASRGGGETPMGAATPPQVVSPRSLPAMPKTPPGGFSSSSSSMFVPSVPADRSLLPRHMDDSLASSEEEPWRDWTIRTSRDGRLFYHHTPTNASQWQMPLELVPMLGEWVPVPATEDTGEYWRNELLGLSSWTDPRGTTSLFQAALDGNLFFLQLYSEVGGFLDSLDASGRSALHYSCAGGSMQGVVYLLQGGATMDIQDQTGSTPLHWACRYGHAPIVRTLLEALSDPNCRNALGDTCMHEAAALGRVDALHWLIQARADPWLRNREARTPLDVATWSHAAEAVALLSDRDIVGVNAAVRDASDVEATLGPAPNERPGAYLSKLQQRRRQSAGDSSSGEEDDDEPEASLALTVVRAARPVLRSVQWLATRVLGEKKTDLGAESNYRFDEMSRQWVLDKVEEDNMDQASAASEESEDSGSDDDWPRQHPLVKQLSKTGLFAPKRAHGTEEDGSTGV